MTAKSINHFLVVYEIANGKVIGLAKDFGIHFTTSQFWSRLEALGGAASAGLEQLPIGLMSMVDVPSHLGVHCVPALIRQANVVNIGREA